MKTILPSRVLPALIRAAQSAGDDYGVTDPPDWRTIDWAAHLHRIDIDGTSVNYVDIGEQGEHRPIVFVHGLSGQWQNWLENIPRFAQERRVVAMDLPGHGMSEMPNDEISIELYGNFVADLCRRLDLVPAVLVGNSMGGFVAAEVAIRAPEVVERLMLLSAAGVSQMELARRPVLFAGKAAGFLATANVAQKRWIARRRVLRHWIMSLIVRHPSRIKADAMFEALMKGADKPGFDDALRACLVYDFRERLPQIGAPTIVIWGEKDMIIPVKDADAFVSTIEGARKVIIEDTGHVPMFERPTKFNDLLAEFLEYDVDEGELEGDPEQEMDSVSGGSNGAGPVRERDASA
ncbi:MAG: alpha/beta fold hydrolase [Actinomycetota bacterium]|nr:alpha/beta fold hydrolase [Actinomycetota bacterium]